MVFEVQMVNLKTENLDINFKAPQLPQLVVVILAYFSDLQFSCV